ncbi:M20/M25/M40 family metallo-hydrolase [Thermospira aquatica]|uniref:M20/M25/M40 family metallo-hydrolase n=1 Tax=Thermospira aquatica TaxID=2828656 RepID=A0AAX3BC66_9SPIR|nr:M20/M25/M40 family metallo-hydrolase [Thermospira aquatica]URA09862.1 M20/M25/M40 family metallo-hydrolase [Thermospira aquatica]
MNDIRRRVVDEFVRQVKIESPSFKEEKMFDYLENRLKSLGITVERLPYTTEEGNTSENLVARLHANVPGKKKLFFDAHVDTVEPGIGITPVVEEEVIRSSGQTILGSDDKAASAAMVIALEELIHREHGDITFIFTSAEEVGLVGVRYLDFSHIEADYGFVLDSHGPVGGIIVAAPTQYQYEIFITGKASHAGIAPEAGKNAIVAAGDLLTRLPQGRINRYTVANVGVIDGGKATNIVADLCHIQGEFRSHRESDCQKLQKHIEKLVRRKSFVRKTEDVNVCFKRVYIGFRYDASSPVIQLASRAMHTLGITPRLEWTGGGSNTNIYNQNGIPAVNLSVGMEEVHSLKEYIRIDDLENLTKLLLTLSDLC